MNWKDTTTYAQGDTDRTPQTWRRAVGPLTLVVTRHIHRPGTWLARCQGVLPEHDLHTDDVSEAKAIATALLRRRLDAALAALEEA